MSEILNKAKAIEGYVINLRREFHKYPELSGKEFKTQEMIIKELEKMGILNYFSKKEKKLLQEQKKS